MSPTSAVINAGIFVLTFIAAWLFFLSTSANSRLEYIACMSGGGLIFGFVCLVVVVDHHLTRLSSK